MSNFGLTLSGTGKSSDKQIPKSRYRQRDNTLPNSGIFGYVWETRTRNQFNMFVIEPGIVHCASSRPQAPFSASLLASGLYLSADITRLTGRAATLNTVTASKHNMRVKLFPRILHFDRNSRGISTYYYYFLYGVTLS